MTTTRTPESCTLRHDHGAGCQPHAILLSDCESCPHAGGPGLGVLHLRGVRRDVQRQLRLEALLRGVTMGEILGEVLAHRYAGALALARKE